MNAAHMPRILDLYGTRTTGTTIHTENRLRYQAQSVLHGLVRDPLPDTAEQAADVLAWAARTYAADAMADGGCAVIPFHERRGV